MPVLVLITDPMRAGGINDRLLIQTVRYFETGFKWDHVQTALRQHFFSIDLLNEWPDLGMEFLATYSTSQNYCTHDTERIEWIKALQSPNSEYSTRVIG